MTDAIPLLQATHAHCACPVCLDVFKDPVCFPCGHVLCRVCAARCIAVRPRCPLCNQAVPNMRHGVALPQLALFCTLAREIGLRVGGRDACRDSSAEGGQGSEAPGPRLKQPRGEEDAGAPGLLGACDGEGDEDGEETRESPVPPLSRTRIDSSDVPLAPVLSTVTAAPLTHAVHLGAMEADARHHLPDLLRDAAAETQRLRSESPPTPQTPPASTPPAPSAPTSLAGGVRHGSATPSSSCPPSTAAPAAVHRDCDERNVVAEDPSVRAATSPSPQLGCTAPPSSSSACPPASLAEQPATTPLRLLRALAEHVHAELECTPRLPTPPPPTRASLHSADEGGDEHAVGVAHTLPPDDVAGAAAASTVWRLWKRGSGVVHCTLTPPTTRWQNALHDAAVEGAVGKEGGDEKTRVGDADGCVAAAATTSATVFHRTGSCALCGLDVVQRGVVRQRLQRLMRSPAAECDPAELAAQTEDSLSLLLGPLWGLRCELQSSPPSAAGSMSSGDGVYTTSSSREARSSASAAARRARGGGLSCSRGSPSCTGLAHHNCLAWAGLLDLFTDTTEEEEVEGKRVAATGGRIPRTSSVLHMTVPLQDPFEVLSTHASGRVRRWQLLAATLWWQQQQQQSRAALSPREGRAGASATLPDARDAPACADTRRADDSAGSVFVSPRCVLCGGEASAAPPSPFGAGLRTCEGTERGESSCGRPFHYPCALLAGAAACIVFGLDDERNVVPAEDSGDGVADADVCVRDRDAGGGKPSGLGVSVEVWCGTCHARHEARRRRHE